MRPFSGRTGKRPPGSWRSYTDSVYAYVRHRLAPRADLVDDVVQDVFLAALGSLSSFLGNAPLRSWLLGIARHKVETFYRQRLREPEPLADSGDAVGAGRRRPVRSTN